MSGWWWAPIKLRRDMLERPGGGGLSFLQENPSKFFIFLRFPFLDSLKLVLRRLSTLRYIRTLRRLCTALICGTTCPLNS